MSKPSTPLGKDTKPSPLSKSITKIDLSALKPKTEDADAALGHVISAAAVARQAQIELAKEKTEDEVRAEKVTGKQIQGYWKEREAERRTKRVHQEGVGVEEKILRLFDVSTQYGVCVLFIAIVLFTINILFGQLFGLTKNSHA